jgi:hypothetical protein
MYPSSHIEQDLRCDESRFVSWISKAVKNNQAPDILHYYDNRPLSPGRVYTYRYFTLRRLLARVVA